MERRKWRRYGDKNEKKNENETDVEMKIKKI